jgi:hypothetical protein
LHTTAIVPFGSQSQRPTPLGSPGGRRAATGSRALLRRFPFFGGGPISRARSARALGGVCDAHLWGLPRPQPPQQLHVGRAAAFRRHPSGAEAWCLSVCYASHRNPKAVANDNVSGIDDVPPGAGSACVLANSPVPPGVGPQLADDISPAYCAAAHSGNWLAERAAPHRGDRSRKDRCVRVHAQSTSRCCRARRRA